MSQLLSKRAWFITFSHAWLFLFPIPSVVYYAVAVRIIPLPLERTVSREKLVYQYARRYLLERGHSENAVDAYLNSPIFEEFYYWVGKGYADSSEAEFTDEVGEQLEERFLTWLERSKRTVRSVGQLPPVNRLEESVAWKLLFLPIPAEWLPETQRREVKLYLCYLQNKMRKEIDRFLHSLNRAVNSGTDIHALLKNLGTTPCVKEYPYKCIELRRSQSPRSLETEGDVVQLGSYGFLVDSSEVKLLVRVAHTYASCFSDMHALNGLLTECPGFLYRTSAVQESGGYEGCAYLLSEHFCGTCTSCKVMTELIFLFQAVWRNLRYWTYAELFDFALHNIPLTPRVGYALFRSPTVGTHFSDLWSPNFLETPANSKTLEIEIPYCGEWELKLLPCLAAKSVEAIYTRLSPRLEMRSWALRLHASRAIHSAARSSEASVQWGHPVWNARLLPGAIGELLAEWNSLAPIEWRFTTRTMYDDFRRALLRARRTIDGGNAKPGAD